MMRCLTIIAVLAISAAAIAGDDLVDVTLENASPCPEVGDVLSVEVWLYPAADRDICCAEVALRECPGLLLIGAIPHYKQQSLPGGDPVPLLWSHPWFNGGTMLAIIGPLGQGLALAAEGTPLVTLEFVVLDPEQACVIIDPPEMAPWASAVYGNEKVNDDVTGELVSMVGCP